MSCSPQPVDARDLGSLFNVQTGQYALPWQERIQPRDGRRRSQ